MAETPSRPASALSDAIQPRRRGFFSQATAVLLGGLVMVFPFAAGMVSFLAPLRRSGGAVKKLRIAPLDAVPDDGVPRRFPVVSDLTDAWTNYGLEPIGAVYLVREKGTDKVLALNAICPHAGCMVGFEASKNLFACPCHTSAFDVQGKRRLDISKVPPRDMDSLESEVRNGEVWVQFRNFQTGHAEKVART